ncbi:hypothetical protein [Mucilaginibacter ginkgonis]|uniref:hypothetical protein n=1 Tax=Mucilaginibacter ginkgonis TaxID=2682091 RepID=UPI001FC7BBF1|nr:hypothetical protein [Mucilaginibacter ginkgonis]
MNFRLLCTFVVLLFGIHTCRANDTSKPSPEAINGVLDLRNQSFSDKISLNGQWKFYWHRLLAPGEKPNEKPIIVDFPFKWNGYKLNGKKLPSFGYATYELIVLLPKNKPQLRLAMPDVYTSYNLFFNGEKMAINGITDTTADKFEPHWLYHGANVPNTDTLHILLQIANFVHSKAGVSEPLILGEKGAIELARYRTTAIDLLLTGCLFMGGLFFFRIIPVRPPRQDHFAVLAFLHDV